MTAAVLVLLGILQLRRRREFGPASQPEAEEAVDRQAGAKPEEDARGVDVGDTPPEPLEALAGPAREDDVRGDDQPGKDEDHEDRQDVDPHREAWRRGPAAAD